ncbi:PR5-like receptor kinase [Mangifera indica]|uniref:PR5-like receptor kinase n=1 Tax=Mangifera indica TaxID=29780 RepID=UPI001CF9A8FF|nr:PR5-like receptor kinase [Mangifera indica]
MLIAVAICIYRSSPYTSMMLWNKKSKSHQSIEQFLRKHGPLAPKRYSYFDVKIMTNSFKHKLGQGGYGGVYKGTLHDGHHVAVKVLTESKGNGEEFINEVASISKTAHVNIVTLLGYCFEGHRRALIYEFMLNGSLEKFIYEKNPLKWELLYQIVMGIARGLEYLHRGCNTRILHFDIKPHNILLDEDFCPKISDFGLAKICPNKESIVSMAVARGTIGYIAPEVFSRNFGEVSHKSDVYSYGMMVLEMTGGRQNKNVQVDNSSEIYFPHWIYKRLEEDEELGLDGISNEEDKNYIRKMMIVSLWCIQTKPSDRPTMSRVIDMLESNLDMLQIPPRPFLTSPSRSQLDSSTLSLK